MAKTVYYVEDGTVYRERPEDGRLEIHAGGKWQIAKGDLFPSEEEYLHFKQISEAEAQERTG